jgi:hypothetical protein
MQFPSNVIDVSEYHGSFIAQALNDKKGSPYHMTCPMCGNGQTGLFVKWIPHFDTLREFDTRNHGNGRIQFIQIEGWCTSI